MRIRVWSGLMLLGGALGCGTGVTTSGDPTPTPTANPNANPPSITAVVPALGFATGGTEIEIQGADLDDGSATATVTFGGVDGTVTAVTATTITVTTPSVPVGDVDVVVTHTGGSDSLQPGFTFQKVYTGRILFDFNFITNPFQFGNPPPANVRDNLEVFAQFAAPQTEPLGAALPALDTCVFNPPADPVPSSLMDAGTTLTMAGPSGAAVTAPQQPDGTYLLDDDNPTTFTNPIANDVAQFVEFSDYALQTSGGVDVPALDISVAIQTPGNFGVDQLMDAVPLANQSRSANMPWTWQAGQSADGAGVVVEGFITGTGISGEYVVCSNLTDDNAFTIPSTEVGKIVTGNAAILYIWRANTSEVTLPDNSTAVVTARFIRVGAVLLIN